MAPPALLRGVGQINSEYEGEDRESESYLSQHLDVNSDRVKRGANR
jgi:hypothetical protein